MRTIAVLLVASAAAAQDKPAPTFKTDIKLTLENSGGKWNFIVEGTTDLPDGVVLKARLFSVEEVDDYKGGKRIDEEPLIQEDRGFRRYLVKGGKIRETLISSVRKPYSIWYRTRLTYDPDIQDVPTLNKAGEVEMKWDSDLRLGSQKEFEIELAAALKQLTKELEEVQSLYRDLRGRFQVWTRKPDAAAFAEWRKGLQAKVDEIRKNNDTRWSIWVVWIERQAKFRFESFCDRFEALCMEFEEELKLKQKLADLAKDPKGNADAIKEATEEEQDKQLRIMYGLSGFMAYFEEAREALGIDTPSDPDLVGAILKEYETATDELTALAVKADAWKDQSAAARIRARRALMKLSTPNLLPRRAYDRVLELSDKFADLYTLLEKTAAGEKAETQPAVTEHAALVAEFRKYAGVK